MTTAVLQEINVARPLRKSPSYPRYKATGIDWLGNVPEHWDVKRLKYLAAIRAGENITALMFDDDGRYPVYGGNGIRGYTSQFTHDGDFVLIGRQGALCGNVHRVRGKFWASEHAAVATCRTGVHADWLAYLVETMDLKRNSETAAQPGLSLERIVRLAAPLPQPDEQLAIAAFLDREMAKIDDLIGKKERAIVLADERRISLVTSAVTRGITPGTRQKPSGMEWLGAIPFDWGILPFRRVLTGIEQGWSPQADHRLADEDEWAVLKVGAVLKGRFRPEEHKALPTDLAPECRFEVKEGDLLLTRGNTPELVADVCVVPVVRHRLTLSDLHYRLALDERCLSKRLACYWLLSQAGRQQIEADAHGTSNSMVKVSQGHIRSWLVLIPPLDEQQRIADYLDEHLRSLDQWVTRVANGISRLREYRAALVSAAVTGQIDVRNCRKGAPCQ